MSWVDFIERNGLTRIGWRVRKRGGVGRIFDRRVTLFVTMNVERTRVKDTFPIRAENGPLREQLSSGGERVKGVGKWGGGTYTPDGTRTRFKHATILNPDLTKPERSGICPTLPTRYSLNYIVTMYRRAHTRTPELSFFR